MIKLALLLLICLIATITDLKYRKVFNWLTLPGMVLGMAINGVEQGWIGVGMALVALILGGLLFFPAFFFGAMGAGDIKLMAVVGSIMGWFFVLNAALYTALAGGVMAMVVLLIKGQLIQTLLNIGRFLRSLVLPKLAIEPVSAKHTFPYALAIATGSLCAIWLPSLISL